MRNKKGITLIALVITIIVIIILAAVSINIAVNDNFFGKTEDAKNMNNEAIANAERDEKESLKQNVDGFKVNDDFTKNGIKIYRHAVKSKKENEITVDSDVKVKNPKTDAEEILIYANESIKELVEIETGLSQYITENNNEDIYFQVLTDRSNVELVLSDETIEKKNVDVLVGEVEIDNKLYHHTKITEIEDPSKTIKVNTSDLKDKLNDLKIIAKVPGSDGDIINTLEFKHSTGSEIKLPNGQNHDIKIVEENGDKTIKVNNISVGSGDEGDFVANKYTPETYLSNKTSITDIKFTNENGYEESKYGVIKQSETTKSSATITDSLNSTVADDAVITLYLVAEEENGDSTTVYMDDHRAEFYNPITNLEVYPTNVPFNSCNELINFKYNAGADVVDIVTSDYAFKDPESISPNPTDNYKLSGISKDNAKGNGKITIENTEKDSWGTEDETKLTESGYNFEVSLTLTDYGGNSLTDIAKINPGRYNFIVYKYDNEKKGYKEIARTTRLENESGALKIAQDNGNDCIIEQIVDEYEVFDIINLDSSTTFTNLIFNLNGNTLKFASDKQLTIGEGFTFKLESLNYKKDNKNYIYKNNTEYIYIYNDKGTMSFKHNKTYVDETIVKHISREDFLSKPEYAKFESIETWLRAEGKSTSIWSKIKNLGTYNTRLLKAYRAYLDSFNYIGWNVDYENTMSGVVNYGTFNFESGKIRLETEEKVKAIGAFGGGVVLNVVDGFLKILEKLGVETVSLTQFTANYAQIDNTGVGIKNYGNVVLGKQGQYDPDGVVGTITNPGEHPEIEIFIETTEENLSITPIKGQNPNRAVSNNYGIWNIDNNATVNMYSGFITMSSLNNCNSWWAVMSIVNSFGIYNEKGMTQIHSVTQKEISKSEDIWKIKILQDWFDIKTGATKVRTGQPKGFFIQSELKLIMEILGGAYYYTRAGAAGIPSTWGENYATNWVNNSRWNTQLTDCQKTYTGSENYGTVTSNYYVYDCKSTTDKIDVRINKQIMGSMNSTSFKENVYQHAQNFLNNMFAADFETNISWGWSRLSESMLYCFFKGDWVHQSVESETIAGDIINSFKRSVSEFTVEYIPSINQWFDEKIRQPWEKFIVEPTTKAWNELKSYTIR